jgi:hypothetical protein
MIAARAFGAGDAKDAFEKEQVVSHTLQLDGDEAEVVVEALRAYRET